MGKVERTVAAIETIDLNQVVAFVHVVDTQSFTAAAKVLGVPKSSVSRAVSKLEQDLGVVLLQRTTRRLSLTDAGTIYLGRAREALQLLSEARDLVVEADEEPRGTVRITAAGDPTGRLVAAPIARFVRLYPQIHVELVITPRRVDLVEEGIDLALRAGRLDDVSLVGKRLDAQPLMLFAAPSYLAAHGTPRKLQDVARHDCVLFRGAKGTARWSLTGKSGKLETVTVRGPVNCDDLPLVMYLTCEGLGIGLMPRQIVMPALASGQLVRVLPQYQLHSGALYLVHPKSQHLPRRVRLLRDFLHQQIRDEFAMCAGHLEAAKPTKAKDPLDRSDG
jgi:DNA-binding transcriptional LysR family regulator